MESDCYISSQSPLLDIEDLESDCYITEQFMTDDTESMDEYVLAEVTPGLSIMEAMI